MVVIHAVIAADTKSRAHEATQGPLNVDPALVRPVMDFTVADLLQTTGINRVLTTNVRPAKNVTPNVVKNTNVFPMCKSKLSPVLIVTAR